MPSLLCLWEMYTKDGSSLCLGVNSVGALNYKDFLLFLFYTFLETTLVTLSLLPHFIAFFNNGEIPGTLGSLATTFLAFAYEKKTTPKWRYDLGRMRNFQQTKVLLKQLS